jgi:hypothetical protein
MAITRDQVKAAVEQYLPRTINYARSADLGEKDRDSIFERLMQIVLTALLLDNDAIFYLIYLSSQKLLTRIDAAIDLLENLQSTDLLKTISEDPPVNIDDLTQLQGARVDLLQLSGSVANDSFGTVHFTDFKNNITGFLTDQIAPNVQGRNRISVTSDMRALMASLATEWDSVLSRREAVFAMLDEFIEQDLRAKVATVAIDAIYDKIVSIEAAIEEQTTLEQAADAETYLVDLAAAQAALKIIGDAPTVLGTAIIEPVDTGYTDPTYLEFIGTARTEPLAYVTSGTEGRLYIDHVMHSEYGRALDDADGDNITPNLRDTTVDFVALDVEQNNFLTFVDTGYSHRIETVNTNLLEVYPEIRTSV